MAINYEKAASRANYQARNPFHQEEGDYLVIIQDMQAVETRENGDADVCNWKILRALRGGDPSLEGLDRSRLRIINRDGTMDELQNRVLVGLSLGKRLRKQNADPHFEFPKANWNGALIQNIHETNGKDIAGYPIVISVRQIEMKKKKGEFTAITYRYPSAADLEGIPLDESGRVTE